MTHLIYPRVSEKAYMQASDSNVYTFVVPANMNKMQIKKAVQNEYEVTVTDVTVSVLKGKNKRFMQKRGRQSTGKRQDIRKAYVTLKDGDVIPVFAGSEPETTAPVISTAKKANKESK